MTKKLSKAQQTFLNKVYATPGGYRTPFTGNREAGRTASAWYRTARALAEKGLIHLERAGDAQRALPPEAGACEGCGSTVACGCEGEE